MSATYLAPQMLTNSAVEALDLTAVMAKVVAEHDMDAAMAATAETLYRQFLTLTAANPGAKIVPPRLADLVWHEHITHTRQYMADCQAVFGEYLHHTPGLANSDAFYANVSAPLWQANFNVNLNNFAGTGCAI
jgi:hypothetical protein